jgi:anaerobic ribonucleoside-triphosphate reductase activating protein
VNISSIHKKETINVAATCLATRALGPGLRAVVWVQGCPFHCPGCIAPEWIENKIAEVYSPEKLADLLLADSAITGLTFSGGEPMQQATGLAKLARIARDRRNLNIICFTGYRLEHLINRPPDPGVFELLDQIDLLIDGPYIARLNDNKGLRGSNNQHVHYMTSHLAGIDFENKPRRAEVHVEDGQLLMVGVPPKDIDNIVDSFQDAKRIYFPERVSYERT